MSATTATPPAPPVDEWRGVAAERDDDVPSDVSLLLRARSRRLLRSLLAPHRRALWILLAVILVENAAAMAGPYLVKLGIDDGIPPIARGGSSRTLLVVVGLFLTATVTQAVLRRTFL